MKGVVDVIAEPRYDTVTLLAAGGALLTFFAVPLGQGVSSYGAAGTAKTKSDTNMDLAGQLPAGYTFTILGFRMGFPWNLTLADVQLAFNGAFFEFVIGAKPFLTCPARCLPSGNGPFGDIDAAAAPTQLVTSGYPAMSNSFGIGRKPLMLSPTSNFRATLNWPGLTQAVTTAIAGAAVAGLPITIYLDGILARPAQ